PRTAESHVQRILVHRGFIQPAARSARWPPGLRRSRFDHVDDPDTTAEQLGQPPRFFQRRCGPGRKIRPDEHTSLVHSPPPASALTRRARHAPFKQRTGHSVNCGPTTHYVISEKFGVRRYATLEADSGRECG